MVTNSDIRDSVRPTVASTLEGLAHPQRIRIVGALAAGRQYVSELARRLEMNRPLLHMHLRRLERAGLVSSTLELSPEGKAMRFYDVVQFDIHVTPDSVAAAALEQGESAIHDEVPNEERPSE